MHHIRRTLLVIGVIIAAVIGVLFFHEQFKKKPITLSSGTQFQVTSLGFVNGASIPDRNTCKTNNYSPQLSFKNVPKNTVTMALIMHDVDAPGGDFTHWLVWNIPPSITGFNEGALPANVTVGTTDFGTPAYGGPCPKSGTHLYVIDLYALNSKLNLPTTARRPDLNNAIKGRVIGQVSLSGTAKAP